MIPLDQIQAALIPWLAIIMGAAFIGLVLELDDGAPGSKKDKNRRPGGRPPGPPTAR